MFQNLYKFDKCVYPIKINGKDIIENICDHTIFWQYPLEKLYFHAIIYGCLLD